MKIQLKIVMIMIILLVVPTFPSFAGVSPKAAGEDKNARMFRSSECGLTQEQEDLLCKYRRIRWLIIITHPFSLKGDDSLENIRKWYAMKSLGFEKDPSWEEMMEHQKIKDRLTPELQKKFSKIIFGYDGKTWPEILMGIENMRLAELEAKKQKKIRSKKATALSILP